LDDLGDFYHEWKIDGLPWDAASSLTDTSLNESLDQNLLEAITHKAIPSDINITEQARAAVATFLYLYMVMSVGRQR
jgi:hypothetical protein